MPILKNISELATCPASNAQENPGLISNAAVAWKDDRIAWTGKWGELPARFHDEPVTDCGGRLVIPGLVDCHTHLCFGGWRGDEFDQRLKGSSYQEIALSGGGIVSTVRATRAASLGDLVRKTRSHLDAMIRLGITTVECKSGYGLEFKEEIKQLEAYRELATSHPVTLVPTFLGAHTVPPEFHGRQHEYVRQVCDQMLPEVARQQLAEFCDVFVEEGSFTRDEGRKILQTARALGLGVKIHADQLTEGGGAKLAAELGAISAEHLEYVSEAGIEALASSGTVAVSLPLASLYLRERYLPARKLLTARVPVAVATDFNPGSSPSYHLPLAMLLACLNQHMTPGEVLMGATTVAARALGKHHEIGSLACGHLADITIIDAPSLNHWMYHFKDNACVGVIKNGRWIQRTRGALSHRS